MENNDGTVVQMAAKKPRRPAARKTASSARTGTAKSATRRRPSAKRRKTASKEQSFETVIRNIAGSVAVARAAIAEASGQGAASVKRALGSASASSRRTITRLAKEWKGMDPRKKAQVLAALLGAAAAASAPLVRRHFKK